MTVTIPPDLAEAIRENVAAGNLESPDVLVAAAVSMMLFPFAPGELTALVREGMRDIEAGRVIDGDTVFEEIRRRSAERKRTRADGRQPNDRG